MLTTKMNILICDSDINLSTVLADYLLSRDFAVETVEDGAQALEMLRTNRFNLCLLDLNVPTKTGIEVIANLRQVNNQVPIIVVTARAAREDMIRAFEAGCDDYVVKPFSMEVLIYRIMAVLRRVTLGVDTRTTVFTIAGKTFDSVHQTFDGQHMSSRESDLLLLLCRNMNALVDRHLILGTLWKNDDYFSARSLSVYVNHLRKFINGTGYRIIGVHGKGYKLVDAG